MADQNGTQDKALDQMIDNTIQSRVTGDNGGGVSFLNWVYRSGELISPWWSQQRDKDLMRFLLQSDQFKAAIYKIITKLQSITPRIEPRDATIKASVARADLYNQTLIEDSEFGQGWPTLISKALLSLFSRDNGMFLEIVGDGRPDGPIRGPALGINHLDPTRCVRSGNFEYPVTYIDTDGQRYKLHRTRVAFASQLPSDQATMNGVGLCWVSRAINGAQNLLDIAIFKQEKLGSRPQRQMVIGKNISAQQIWEAVVSAEESMDNSGLRRYSKLSVIGSQGQDVGVEVVDLNNVPDGFDEKTSTELGMFLIALSGGFPARDLWPATTTGATKADAMYQHIGGSAGYQAILDTLSLMLGGPQTGGNHRQGKFLPPDLKLVFDLVDDEQDARNAEIGKARAEGAQIRLLNEVTDIRTEREKALRAGDITAAQFDALELEAGRLPHGNSVLTLFLVDDPRMGRLLALPVSDPLNVEANRVQAEVIVMAVDEKILEVQTYLANANRAIQQVEAKQAIAALEAIRELYVDTENAQPDAAIVEEAPVETMTDGEPPQMEQAQPPPAATPETMKQLSVEDDLEEILGDLPPEAEQYFNDLVALVEAGQTGVIDRDTFVTDATGITEAIVLLLFLLGSGKDEASLTEADRTAINSKTETMVGQIDNLATDTYDNAFVPEDDGGSGNSLAARAVLWAGTAAGAYALGKLFGAAAGTKFRWQWTEGKDHCKDCLEQNGKVRTAAEWQQLATAQGIYPKSWDLECRGVYCGCEYVEVKEKAMTVSGMQANYRRSMDAIEAGQICEKCAGYNKGYCLRHRMKADGRNTCDEWTG